MSTLQDTVGVLLCEIVHVFEAIGTFQHQAEDSGSHVSCSMIHGKIDT